MLVAPEEPVFERYFGQGCFLLKVVLYIKMLIDIQAAVSP